ncbi:MAG TPA: exodeoxyribonuclease V subunit beta, partial [Polyangiaceae bacterium]|nr:exodeoxyribonuclease V subunit beta [Polyangiaceae bacterium]
RLLLETEHQPRQLLVVTFTEAATAELKDRVRARLRECQSLANSPELPVGADAALAALLRRAGDLRRVKQRLEQALYAFDEVEISTIHGFCQRVLMERAFQSDLSYGSELYGDARPLIDELILDFWAVHAGPAAPELLAYMRSEGSRFNLDMARRLAYAVQRAPEALLLPELPARAAAPDSVPFREQFARSRAIWQRHDVVRLIEASSVRKQSYNRRYLPAWVAEVSAYFANEPGLFLALPRCFERFCSERLAQAGGASLAEHEVFRACDSLAAAYEELESALAAELLRFKRALLEYVRLELPRRTSQLGLLSFDDLLSKLERALAGPAGQELALAIRERYPVALIDEFQDTDPTQLAIFERIYAGPNTSLFLIGDPKQAIYSFRGADVYSYVGAARATAAERHFTMTTNYRSDPSLVAAVNHLFSSCPRPFLLPEIGFEPVAPRPGAADTLFAGDGSKASGLEILLAEASPEQPLDTDFVLRKLPGLIATEIAHSLASDSRGPAGPLRPADIAVLTRTNDQAFQIQAALRAAGIASVVLGDKSVYDSAEARDLERILAALVEPSNVRLIRAALASELMGVTANELLEMEEEDGDWERWLVAFQDLAASWAQTGFVHMCRELLSRYGLEQRLLSLADGERRMTNLLQLVELLHGASLRSHLGPSGLLHYLGQQRRRGLIGMEAESAQIRLESDAEAVKITTMHKSKGLEYPVVYCPYLWHGILLLQSDEQAPKLHLADGRLAIDLGSSERTEHVARARWEQFAENLRLTYVALTRARHRCSVVWGRIGRHHTSSAFGYLLHPLPSSSTAPDVAAIQAHLGSIGDAALRADLDRHVEAAPIRHRRLGFPGPLPAAPVEEARGSGGPIRLVPRRPAQRIDERWRSSSFSALTSRAAQGSVAEAQVRDHDAAEQRRAAALDAADALAASPAPASARLRLADFPRGANAGSFFHDVLEHYDFTSPRSEALRRLVRTRLPEYGYEAEPWLEPVCEQLLGVLDTPLSDQAETARVRLADVPLERRLTELEFCLPVAQGTPAGEPRALEARHLARIFREHPSAVITAEYAEAVGRLGFVPLRGYLRGFIDLVFQHGEQFFVVDYKGNYLGDHAEDYGPAALGTAMLEGQYFLQYHLYALAVHRYLARRISQYDFGRHFGGVYYLFLRGMGPEHGQAGVFFEKPPLSRLDALSRLLNEVA